MKELIMKTLLLAFMRFMLSDSSVALCSELILMSVLQY